jgi:osmoprotectant transport system substrate-binding protein
VPDIAPTGGAQVVEFRPAAAHIPPDEDLPAGSSKRSFPMALNLTRLTLLLFGLLTLLPACQSASSEAPVIRLGYKRFIEQAILRDLYRLLLEQGGFTVDISQGDLQETAILHSALLSGTIDIYPEYTGTALQVVLDQPKDNDAERVAATVAAMYRSQFNLIWLQRAPLNNTWAIAMSPALAGKYGITTISDFVAHASQFSLVGPPDFQSNPDAMPAMKQVYGEFTLKRYSAVHPNERYQTFISNRNDAVVAFSTDGELNAYNLMLLEDDRQLFAPYQVAPVVRGDVLEQYPQIRTILDPLAPLLTDTTMQRLNNEVSGKHRPSAYVAREFLIQAGLLKPTQ